MADFNATGNQVEDSQAQPEESSLAQSMQPLPSEESIQVEGSQAQPDEPSHPIQGLSEGEEVSEDDLHVRLELESGTGTDNPGSDPEMVISSEVVSDAAVEHVIDLRSEQSEDPSPPEETIDLTTESLTERRQGAVAASLPQTRSRGRVEPPSDSPSGFLLSQRDAPRRRVRQKRKSRRSKTDTLPVPMDYSAEGARPRDDPTPLVLPLPFSDEEDDVGREDCTNYWPHSREYGETADSMALHMSRLCLQNRPARLETSAEGLVWLQHCANGFSLYSHPPGPSSGRHHCVPAYEDWQSSVGAPPRVLHPHHASNANAGVA
jgi:hypothetical protein